MLIKRRGLLTKVLLACAFMTLALSACKLEGLTFREDRRVSFVSPRYREKITAPITVDWQLNDYALGTSTRDGTPTAFGVYVDIDPQPPGEPLSYFARNDPACRESEGCPDKKYLEQRGVYVTTSTEMSFQTLPPAPGVDLARGHPDVHEVTLVLLDADSVRIGESAWAIIFEIIREEG